MELDRVREAYDAVAERYAEELHAELAGKPLDRALLQCLVDLVADDDATGSDGVTRRIIADVGCGPGHVATHLRELGAEVVGVDLSPVMIQQARTRWPEIPFLVGSMLGLAVPDGTWRGAVCAYSVIHFDTAQRNAAFAELARVVAVGGWLLVAFHISAAGVDPGGLVHVEEWWAQPVDLDFRYLDPDVVTAELGAAGWRVHTRVVREHYPALEFQSRRAYLLAQRVA